jgi:hypothetical protein
VKGRMEGEEPVDWDERKTEGSKDGVGAKLSSD